jgi:ATP synthase protein I
MHSYDAAVLRAAGAPATAAGVVACLACARVWGGRGLLGAVLATAVTAVVFSATLALCSVTRALRPTAVTAVALGGYAVTAVVLGVLLVLTAGLDALEPAAVATGLVVGAFSWTAGEVRAFTRLRTPYVEPEGWDARSAPTPTPSAGVRA